MNKKNSESQVIIVLASFNGESFLAEQLDSLITQTQTCWRLLIRDDGSVDESLRIIREYQRKDQRIELLKPTIDRSGSALGNFAALLSIAYRKGADYIFCCDQDDVWEVDKLELMLARLKQLEGKERAPSLLHHDLAVVNESLEPIADSFIDMMQLQPTDQQNPQRLITRNEVTGCALVCNRALLEIALPVSDQAVMHDWWLALCAGYFGRLEFMPDKLVKYRQHSDNTIGAKSFWHGLNPFTNWIAGWRRGDAEFISTIGQARAFNEAMSERLEPIPEASAMLDRYSRLEAMTRWQRLQALREFGLWRSHWLLNIVLVMRMVLLSRKTEL